MIGHDYLDVRVGRDIAGECGRARAGIGIGRGIDLEVVDHQAALFQRVDDALGPFAAARLGEQAPDHGPVTGGQLVAVEDLFAKLVAGRVVHRADIAEAAALILAHGRGQLGVLAGHDDALCLGIVDQRRERIVAGVAHDRDAVRRGGDRLLELRDHLLGIPIGEDVLHGRPQIRLGLTRAVVDIVGEDAAGRPAGEEDDVDAGTPLARIGVTACTGRRAFFRQRHRAGGQHQAHHDERRESH